MKKYLVLLPVILLILACAGDPSTVAATGGDPKPDGQKIYKKYCVTCHGADGSMGMNGAKNLQESELGLEERVSLITNGRNMMAAYKGILSKEEIRAVAKYTEELKVKSEVNPPAGGSEK